MDLDIEDGLELIVTAQKKQGEERLWEQWLVERPYFKEFISFDDYKKKAIKPIIRTENRDVNKILEEAEKIKNADQGREEVMDEAI